MSKDSILGWTLILLVGISLFLSFNIWSRVPGYISVTKINQEENKIDPSTVLSPRKIQVYMGNSLNTIIKGSSPLYERTWDFAKSLLTAQWTISPEPSEAIKRESFRHKKGLELFFPTPLPMSFVKQFLNISTGDISHIDERLIDSVVLIDDEGLQGYLVDSDGLFYSMGKSESAEKLNSIVREISNSNPPLYASLTADVNLKIPGGVYVSLLSYELPVYSLKTQPVSEERLASNFFTDFSVTRRIQERDGTVIYTDGTQGLRIYKNGAIEYNLPGSREQRKGLSMYDAFKTAIDFVNSHGGWDENVYLDSYTKDISQTMTKYTFNFKIRVNGLTLTNVDDYLNVTVEGNQVKNYYRNVSISTKQEGLMELMPPIEALNTAVSTKNIKVLDDIYPGYIIQDEKLIPVWIIKTSGMEVVIQDLPE